MGIVTYTSASCSVENGNVFKSPKPQGAIGLAAGCSVNLMASYSAFSRNRQTFRYVDVERIDRRS